jgi:hypothetical protein
MATDRIFLDLGQGDTIDKVLLLRRIVEQRYRVSDIVAVVGTRAAELGYRYRRVKLAVDSKDKQFSPASMTRRNDT